MFLSDRVQAFSDRVEDYLTINNFWAIYMPYGSPVVGLPGEARCCYPHLPSPRPFAMTGGSRLGGKGQIMTQTQTGG